MPHDSDGSSRLHAVVALFGQWTFYRVAVEVTSECLEILSDTYANWRSFSHALEQFSRPSNWLYLEFLTMACPVRVLVFKVHQWARRANMKGKLERIGALIVGAGIGAGVALLFAPKTGKQTRRDLRRSATRSLDRLEDLQGDIRKHMTDWVEEASAAVASGIQCGKESARQGGDRVIHVLENARKYMEEGKERVQRYVKSVAS